MRKCRVNGAEKEIEGIKRTNFRSRKSVGREEQACVYLEMANEHRNGVGEGRGICAQGNVNSAHKC